MRSIIKGIILGIFLSIILSPITVSAKESVASHISSLMKNGVKNHSSYIVIPPNNEDYVYITTAPSGESREDIYTNYGKGWKFAEKELNEIGVYLDENGMIIDDTVYTMPKN